MYLFFVRYQFFIMDKPDNSTATFVVLVHAHGRDKYIYKSTYTKKYAVTKRWLMVKDISKWTLYHVMHSMVKLTLETEKNHRYNLLWKSRGPCASNVIRSWVEKTSLIILVVPSVTLSKSTRFLVNSLRCYDKSFHGL